MEAINKQRLESLKDQLSGFYKGANWVTDGFLQRLNQLDENSVHDPFLYFNHTLPELVAHIISWKIFVIKKLEGDSVFDIEQNSEQDWPMPKSWKKLIEELASTQDRLIKAIGHFDPHKLDEKVAGRSYTFNYLLQGLVHHDYYHYGQVGMMAAALKRRSDQEASPLV